MSISIVQCRQDTVGRGVCLLQSLQQKAKITKGFHLVSPRSGTSPREENFKPLKCVSLLSGPPSCSNTPTTTPRRQEYDVNSAQAEDDDNAGILSIVGERLDSFTGLNNKLPVSEPFIRINSHRRNFYHQGASDVSFEYDRELLLCHDVFPANSSFSLEFNSPEVPPVTPNPQVQRHSKNFHVDGFSLNCNSGIRIASSRDFNPGYVKRSQYCCSKCEMRMVGHESLHIDTECPFSAYLRQSRMHVATTGDDDDELGLRSAPQFYDFLSSQQTLPASARYDRICERYETTFDRQCASYCSVNKAGTSLSDEGFDQSLSGSLKEAHPLDNDLITNTSTELHLNKIHTKNHNLDVISDTQSNDFCKHSSYEFKKNTNDETIHLNASTETCSETSSYSEDNVHGKHSDTSLAATPQRLIWSETWNRREAVLSPIPTRSISRAESRCMKREQEVGDCCKHNDSLYSDIYTYRNAARNVNSNTLDEKSIGMDTHNKSDEGSRTKLHEILRGCADSFRNMARASTERDSMDSSSGNKRDALLPDISYRKDICYQPMIDKRYNRWKRRKRKAREPKAALTPSQSGSSCEENLDINHIPDNIRRRKKHNSNDSREIAQVPYDASSEMTSSDVYKSQTENAQTSDENESKEMEVKCQFDRYPSSSYDLGAILNDVDESQYQLTSFPALNSYHYHSSRFSMMDSTFVSQRPTNQTSESLYQSSDNGKDSDNSNTEDEFKSKPTENISPTATSQEDEGCGIAPPLVSQDVSYVNVNQESERKSALPAHQSLSGGIRYPQSHYDSLAKNTIFRVSYSIGEKIRNAAEPEQQKFKAIKIKSHSSKSRARETTNVPTTKMKQLLTPTLKLKELKETTKPDINKLTLSHLLHSISGRNKGTLQSPKSLKPVKKDSQEKATDQSLAPRVTKAKVLQRSSSLLSEGKETSIDRRTCVTDKIPALDQGRSIGQRSNSTPAIKLKATKSKPVSILSLSPAFTFSYFQLPASYKLQGSIIERRKLSYC